MKTVAHIFADITASLEDMHAIAVEGQVPGLSQDEALALLSILRAGMERLEHHLAETRAALR